MYTPTRNIISNQATKPQKGTTEYREMEVYRPVSSYIKFIDKCNPFTPTAE